MLTVQNISKFLGKRELFCGVSFHIRPGERLGFIGPNGAGKTTLFLIMLGEMEPDSGTVTKPKGVRLGYLPQEWTPHAGKTVLSHAMDIHQELEAVRSELREIEETLHRGVDSERARELALRHSVCLEHMEHLAGYDLEARACTVLHGLGFEGSDLDRPIETLSGGWIMRLELARLLVSEPDLLLLDEPTNHLDLDSLLWLEKYLCNTSSAVMVISHDRTFLNGVVSRILELEGGKLQDYPGNYDFYLTEKAQRKSVLEASYRNQQERIRQMERFIERNRVRKDRARQAQSRMKQLDKIERIALPEEEAKVHFSFPEPLRSGKRVMELRNVGKIYPGGQSVYEDLNLVVERGDRIALLGRNGAGKSTLIKMLAGIEDPSSGERKVGHQVTIGYYAQNQWEQLSADKTVLEEASSVAGDMSQTQLRGLLGAFLFRGDDVMKKVAVLSGGEKARLVLCKLLLQRPNFLLLDEPTNHLDILSRDVLEKALSDFSGTICFISHDRHFINCIANKIGVVESGHLHIFPGNYRDYEGIWKSRLDGNGTESFPEEGPAGNRGPQQVISLKRDQARKRLEAEKRNEIYRLKKPLQDSLRKLEADLDEAHTRLDELTERLGQPETYQDRSLAQAVRIEFQQCRDTIARLTAAWEECAARIEEIEENFAHERS